MNNELKISNKENIFIKVLFMFILVSGTVFSFSDFNEKDRGEVAEKEEEILIFNSEVLNNGSEEKNIKKDKKAIQEEKSVELKEREKTIEEDETVLPNKIYYEVDFISQAPLGIWDELHEETCEEASLVMVYYYLTGKSLTKEKMEEEIQMLVKYQKEKYGDYKDSDIKKLKEIAEEFYNIENIKILNYFEVNDLKKELVDGRLIIIPVAGRKLGNPNFTLLGPLYHNLVLIGYDETRKVFITNDPGTRNGQNYEYTYQTLYNAIYDFPGDKTKILEGEKRALVL